MMIHCVVTIREVVQLFLSSPHMFARILCVCTQCKNKTIPSNRLGFFCHTLVNTKALLRLLLCHAMHKRVRLGCDHFHPLVATIKRSSLSPLKYNIYFTGALMYNCLNYRAKGTGMCVYQVSTAAVNHRRG